MGFLTLGVVVGTLVTKTVRRLFGQHLSQADDSKDEENISNDHHSGGGQKNSTSVRMSTASEANPGPSMDPCEGICRFPNRYNNCWMNATLQATLNLEVVRRNFMGVDPEFLMQISQTPAFVGLFMEALYNPGRRFTSQKIPEILFELSHAVPALYFAAQNDPLDLLEYMLAWFTIFDIRTDIHVSEESRCGKCKCTRNRYQIMGSVYYLQFPTQCKSVASLLRHAATQTQCLGQCATCGSVTETQQVWVDPPDILTVYLVRVTESNDLVNRGFVTPTQRIEVPVTGDKTQAYSLSSVVSRSGLTVRSGHVCTYLFSRLTNDVIKANDEHISVVLGDLPDDIYNGGIIYLYEKST